MKDNLLISYIIGQASEKEIAAVRKWASESEERRAELSRIKNIWIIAGLNNELDPAHKEKAIQQILTKLKMLKNSPAKKRKSIQLQWIKYVAAIVLIFCLSGTIGYFGFKTGVNINQTGYTEIIVPNGERSNVVLPDGSKVQLNSGSSLKFEPSFSSGKRSVVLNGEAFFEVTHDKSNPFFVETSQLKVKVLGTKFNVCSYNDDPYITTFLESGKVEINIDGGQDIILNPSEAIKFEKKTNKASMLVIQDTRYTDWTKGLLTIKGETIAEMSIKLERRFGIQILFGDNEVKKRTYSGSIKDEDLITVLEAIKFTSSLTYKKSGNKVLFYTMK